MKKILITGGSGFIGRNLKEYLDSDYEVFAPSHRELDLCDGEMVEKYLREHMFDVVIHSANTNNTRKKETTAYESLDGNLRMFFNLKRYNKLFDKMYYFGSGAEYDVDHYVPLMSEEYFGTYIPKDPYGFSKYVMSDSIADVDNIFDLRLFGVYGKYEEWERRFISNNICRILSGLPVSVNQNRYFDYLYISDLCNIMRWFIEHRPKHKHYNVCTGKSIDLLSIAKIIQDQMRSKEKILLKSSIMGKEYSGNNSRMLFELGEFSFSDIRENIKELVCFYKENSERVNYKEGI